MSEIDKLLEELETPAGKAKMDVLIAKYAAKEKIKNEKIKEMMSDVTYFDWLIQFTKSNVKFCDDDWLYCPEKITEIDRKNVENLNLFYDGIEQYAKKNGINPIPLDFTYGYYYKIRLGDIGFKIGVGFGQGTFYTCDRTVVTIKEDYINFIDVILDKEQENKNQNNITLDSLSSMIKTLYESGVPIDSILNTVDTTVEEIIPQKKYFKKIKS